LRKKNTYFYFNEGKFFVKRNRMLFLSGKAKFTNSEKKHGKICIFAVFYLKNGKPDAIIFPVDLGGPLPAHNYLV